MTEAERVAKGLTKAMVDCLRSASPTFGGAMQVWHPHRSTIKAVHARGLCDEPSWRGTANLTTFGLVVRDICDIIRSEDNG